MSTISQALAIYHGREGAIRENERGASAVKNVCGEAARNAWSLGKHVLQFKVFVED